MAWKDEQHFELNWHNTYPFHYSEQVKQEVYAEKIGLDKDYSGMDLKGQKILDVGAGPVSMLLKYHNHKDSVVYDPLMDKFPEWVRMRYKDAKLTPIMGVGEDLKLTGFDECWSYNVGQHVINAEQYFKSLKKTAKIVRIFEWIDMPPEVGHPHTLTEANLNKWLGGVGHSETINDRGAHGKCFYGVFI